MSTVHFRDVLVHFPLLILHCIFWSTQTNLSLTVNRQSLRTLFTKFSIRSFLICLRHQQGCEVSEASQHYVQGLFLMLNFGLNPGLLRIPLPSTSHIHHCCGHTRVSYVLHIQSIFRTVGERWRLCQLDYFPVTLLPPYILYKKRKCVLFLSCSF